MKDKRENATPEQIIKERRIKLRDREALSTLLQKTLVMILAVTVIFCLIFGLTSMKGGDMEPKISAGDLLLYYRLQSDYVRNDVVIMERDDGQYVGRVIALPGENINISTSGIISIDGNNIYESDIYFETKPYPDTGRDPRTMGGDEYFILGDRRESAKDSRYFGPVKKSEIKGKVITSINRIGL